jgi:hypothetical protein
MRENSPKSDFLITPCQNTNPRQSSKKISEISDLLREKSLKK